MQNGVSLDEIALWNVLVNPSTPARTLARFGRAAPLLSLWVVQSVASNPSTPATVLRRLANHREVASQATPRHQELRSVGSQDQTTPLCAGSWLGVTSCQRMNSWSGLRQIERWRRARHTDRMSRSSWIPRANSTWRSESRRLAIN
jgi:hypothetical protein